MSLAAPEHYPRVLHAEPRPRLRWPLYRAYLQYGAWQVATKAILGVLYFAVISEGLRLLIPSLGMKIRKLPALDSFADYEATYRLDLAHFFAIFLLVAAWCLWAALLRAWLNIDRPNSAQLALVYLMALVILTADAWLFYLGMAELNWGGSKFSLAALLATAAYIVVLMFVTYVAIGLKETIQKEKSS
jgi:hypothetical protein